MGSKIRQNTGVCTNDWNGVYLSSADLVLVPFTGRGRRRDSARVGSASFQTHLYRGELNNMMVQESKEQRYRGVLCSCCRQPIPLPAIILRMELASADTHGAGGYRVFSLRCRVCEREMPYRASEAIEIEGAPRSRVTRSNDRATLLRQQERISRAANG